MWYSICYFGSTSVLIVGGMYLMIRRIPPVLVKISDLVRGGKS